MNQISCKTYCIQGQIVDQQTRLGLGRIRVEVWDKDMIKEDLVGYGVTDRHGGFQIQFAEADFKDWFFDRQPDLYFKVYDGERLIASTETTVKWNTTTIDKPICVEVNREAASIGAGLGITNLFQFTVIRPVQQANLMAVLNKCASATTYAEKSSLHEKLEGYRKENNRQKMIDEAKTYRASNGSENGYISDLNTEVKPIADLINLIYPVDRSIFFSELIKVIQEAFGWLPSEDVISKLRSYIEANDYKIIRRRLGDSLMADAIDSSANPTHRDKLVQAIRMCRLLELIAREDKRIKESDDIEEALKADVLLPKDVFPLPFRTIVKRTSPKLQSDRGELIRKLGERLVDIKRAIRELEQIRSNDYAITSPINPKDGEVLREPRRWVLSQEAIQRLSQSTRQVFEEGGFDLQATTQVSAINYLQAELIRTGAMRYSPRHGKQLRIAGSSRITFDDTGVFGRRALLPLGGDDNSDTTMQTVGAIRDLGVIDYMVVRQKLLRYELGEVAHVENVLRGEYRERMHRRARRVEEAVTVETERKEESERDLQTTERFELKLEATETLKEDQKVQAGVTATYKGPCVEVSANASYSGNWVKEKAHKTASTYAKDVVSRSLSRLQERVREERVRKTIEEFEERNTHGIDNKGQSDHVIGVYRWLDKVYEAQIYNYGRKMLLEFIVPEPGLFFLEAMRNKTSPGITLVEPDEPIVVETINSPTDTIVLPLDAWLEENNLEKPPEDLPLGTKIRILQPKDIQDENYSYWVGKYQTTTVEPPPDLYKTLAHTWSVQITRKDGTPQEKICDAQKLVIDDGYKAIEAWAQADVCNIVPGGEGYLFCMQLALGNTKTQIWNNPQLITLENTEYGEMPMTLIPAKGPLDDGVYALTAAVEIKCKRTDRKEQEWQLGAYTAIMQAYHALKTDYEEKRTALEIQEGVKIVGRNSLLNREIEQIELKKNILMMLTHHYFDDVGAITESQEGYPEVDFDKANQQAPRIRFLEQAFEWHLMTYLFYPYFWGTKSQWVQKLVQIEDTDPIFEKFLKAGAARVVVPVREGYQDVVLSMLYTNNDEPWLGAENVVLSDEKALSLAEELKEQLGANNDGEPVGDSWEVRVPTDLVMLQENATLPGVYAQYKVKPGDNLDNIAGKFGTTVEILQQLNQFDGAKIFASGQFIKVPSNS